MSFITYKTNKKTGTVYAYRVESYRDPETKRPKSRRTYLGRVDPATQLIVGKGEPGTRNRTKLGEAEETDQAMIASPDASKVIEQQRNQIQMLQNQLSDLNARNQKLVDALKALRASIDQCLKEDAKKASAK